MPTGFPARFALWAAVAAAVGGLAPSASAQVYDRNAAVNYANANWNKVVADGYFWINSSTATYYGAGQPVPVNAPNEAGGIGDDCAHFVSSCLGSPAGRLTIPSRAGTYGEPGAARLDELLVGSSLGGYGTTYKYGQLVSSVSQLTPGDVIGYDWDGSGGGSMSGIDHTVIYLGNGQIAAHAASHDGVAWNWGNGSSTKTFFVHITLHDSIVPTAPTNSSPAANATVSSLTPLLTGSAFSDGAIGSTQTAAEWKIFRGGALVYDTGTDTADLLGLTVPAGILTAGNSYTWQVRYGDNYGDWSSYSPLTSFSIAPVPEPSSFGLIATGAVLLVIRRRRPIAGGGSRMIGRTVEQAAAAG
jgi:cell wall-associated NlpC family hydrolase